MIKEHSISSKFVRMDNLNIHYLTAGEGEPVVLLHGIPTSSYLWRKVMEPLAKTKLVIAPDFPGFGKSEKPLDASYTLDYYSKILDGFLNTLGLKQINLVVHDLGGPIGSLWAVRNIKKIKKFVILDTFLYPEPSFWVKLSLLPAKIPGIRYWLVSPSGIATMMKWGISRKEIITDELISAYQTPYDSVEARQVLLKIFNSFKFDDLKEVIQKLPSLSVPISIVYGENDSLLAPEMCRLKKDMPNALCTVIPNSGHFIQEDQPEKLSELLVEFLS